MNIKVNAFTVSKKSINIFLENSDALVGVFAYLAITLEDRFSRIEAHMMWAGPYL